MNQPVNMPVNIPVNMPANMTVNMPVNMPIGTEQIQINQAKPITPINQNQVNKLNQLGVSIVKPVVLQEYNLEYIFNKIKEIGRLVQLIRVERRGVIYGNDLWELINKVVGEEKINSDLIAETKNYEFNMSVMNAVENRINSIEKLNLEAYPDYYMNNLIKLYNQNNVELNMVSIMHMGLDIGELEYLMHKYMLKPILPCYVPKKYDSSLFIKILSMIQTMGRTFKNSFVDELPEDKQLLPQMLVKHIQNLVEEMGSELIYQMKALKINRDKIKIFFDIVLDDDLHNADDFNIQEEDTMGERVYKVAYKYLRDDFTSGLNDYELLSSYKILFTMLDLYDYDKPNLPIDKIIELMFYSGNLLSSIGLDKEKKTSTFLDNMKGFDDESINKLFDINSYFENNIQVPNKQIVDLLDKIQKKITTTVYPVSSKNLVIIPEHIKYLPIEITQLLCIIKPKAVSDIELLIQKLNELTVGISNPQNIDFLFNTIKETTNLDDEAVITSIITPENDLDILNIDENAQENGEDATQENGEEQNQEEQPITQEGTDAEPPVSQEEATGGSYYKKYKKYKVKYLELKNHFK